MYTKHTHALYISRRQRLFKKKTFFRFLFRGEDPFRQGKYLVPIANIVFAFAALLTSFTIYFNKKDDIGIAKTKFY